jgi:hypothetical protein
MEDSALKILKILTEYGALGVLAIIGFVLYFLERKSLKEERETSSKLADKLYELSKEHLRSDLEGAESARHMEKIMDGLLSALKGSRDER